MFIAFRCGSLISFRELVLRFPIGSGGGRLMVHLMHWCEPPLQGKSGRVRARLQLLREAFSLFLSFVFLLLHLHVVCEGGWMLTQIPEI